MSVRRFTQCCSVAAGLMLAASAMAVGNVVSVTTTDDCSATGTVTVHLKLSTAGASNVAGGQFFLSNSGSLTFSSISAGPNLDLVYSTHTATTVDVAVGVRAANQVIGDGDTFADIVFTYSGTICNAANLVSFRNHAPDSALTDNNAAAVSFTSTDLGSITLGDSSAPTITGGPVLAPITANADTGFCSAVVSITPPAASDNCGVTTFGGTRGDSLPLSAAYPVGTTVITWTAGDRCGHTTSATQNVVVSDTQAPSIACGATLTANNDVGFCSALLTVAAPTVGDNCPGVGTPVASLTDGGAAISFPYAFPVGTTTLYWRVTDAHSNVSSCTQDVIVSDAQSPSLTPPSAITRNADASACTLTLSAAQLGAASASDNCPGVGTPIASLTLNGPAITFPYAFPTGATTVFWRVTDAHANTTQATQIVTANAFNTVNASVKESGLGGTSTRGITFSFYTTAACPSAAYTTCQDVAFSGDTGSVSFDVPCGVSWTGVTATDIKHTLRRTTTLGTSGGAFTAAFTGSKALEQGNVNNDGYIDILDFGGFIGKFQTSVGADSACGAAGLRPDFTGDGFVDAGDFTFIQLGFLHPREADPCGGSLVGDAPVSDISVDDLVARGMRDIAMADFNLDGRVNAADVAWVAANGLPRCVADFNDDQSVSVPDIFAYLNAWFAGHPRADVNGNTQIEIQDIFSFLNVWFQGC